MKVPKCIQNTATPPAGTGATMSAVMVENANPAQKPLQHTKHHINICTWNVLALLQPGSLELLDKSLENHGVHIACLQETRISGDNTHNTKNYKVYTSGYDDNRGIHGVGIAIDKKLSSSVQSWKATSPRVCSARIFAKPYPLSIICGYAPTEDAEALDKDEFYRTLQKTLEECPNGDVIILAGDLNASLGQAYPAEQQHIGRFIKTSKRNDNGERLAMFAATNDLAIANTMYQKKNHQLYTWISRDRRTRNQIDFILIKRRWRTAINDIRARSDKIWIDSDHRMVKCNLKTKLRTYVKTHRTVRLNLDALQHTGTSRKYCTALCSVTESTSNVNQKWEILRDSMISSAKKNLGISCTVRKPWISDETLKAIRTRENLKAKGAELSKIAAQRKLVKKLIRKDKNCYLDMKSDQIEDANERGHTREMYRLIRTLSGAKSSSSQTVKGLDGQQISDSKEVMQRWATHFCQLLNADNSPAQLPKVVSSTGVFTDIDQGEPLRSEIEVALASLHNHRAGGCDHIPPELFKKGGERIVLLLKDLFKNIWREEAVPDEWRTSILLPFHKKGDKLVCSNYRGISLLCIGLKILEAILLARFDDLYDSYARDNQAGFKKGRGCRDQVFALRQIIEQRSEYNRPTVMVFIDFKAAFDSVKRDAIWKILEDHGMPDKLLRILRNMYSQSNSIVRRNDNLSEAFHVETGVRQGGVLSPFLFNILIDRILNVATDNTNLGIRLETSITDLDYADDICLPEDNPDDAQNLLNRVVDAAKLVGLQLNESKTKCMFSCCEPTVLFCNGVKLENVTEFDYLGSRITCNGDITPEVQHRIASATRNAAQLKKFWSNRNITTRTKSKVYKACVRSALLYGAETWPVKKGDLARLSSFETRCARRFVYNGFEIATQELLRKAQLDSPMDYVLRRMRLKWCGHVFRMPDERVTKEALFFEKAPTWKRPRGGVRRTWRSTVAADLERVLKPPNMRADKWRLCWKDACMEAALDRKRWRAIVRDSICG